MAEGTDTTFSFGRNWERFIRSSFTPERVEISKRHLLSFLDLEDLRGRFFLDVGCGSGLSSLAAHRARAARVLSFDVDPHSVATTLRLREMEGNPDNWAVMEGSVLDTGFLSTLEPVDVVYAWGALHHTGSMWRAIENLLPLVDPCGAFYVALYTTTPESSFWIEKKQEYNAASVLKKRWMEMWYVVRWARRFRHSGGDPLAYIRGYRASRGMAFMTDVRDWLGGWPYEDASVDEVRDFVCSRGFRLTNLATGQANTEYLFEPHRPDEEAFG